MTLFADPFQTLFWTIRLLAIGSLIDSLEQFYNLREFKNKGLYDWQFLRENAAFTKRRLTARGLLDSFFDYPVWIFFLSLRFAGVLLLLLFPSYFFITVIGLSALFITTALMNLRAAPYGADTPNRFMLVVTGALLLRCAAPESLIVLKMCLWFLALQSCLSYFTAGIVKLINEGWRTGNGLFNVVNNSMNGIPSQFAEFFYNHKTLGKVITWSVIVIECTFPLVLLVGSPLCFLFLAWGVLFHFMNAVLLGFNKFLWAWLATYPAILYVSQCW